MQSESSYIKSLAEIGCLEDMDNFKGLAYPCNNAPFGRFRTGRHTAPKKPRHLSLKVTAETFQEVATGEGGGALDRATPGRTAPRRRSAERGDDLAVGGLRERLHGRGPHVAQHAE